jgi:chromosome partitioning protein
MPIIVFSSPKGGCGKTTAAVILATELATRGVKVTAIDADPNRDLSHWFQLPGAPAGLDVISEVSHDTIMDHIESAAARSAFVIVDLEGTASLLAAHTISFANFVIIPMQGSHLDAKHAGQQIKLIRLQERSSRRPIPFGILQVRTNAAITPRTQKHVETKFAEAGIPVFAVKLGDREAYRALFSYGGTLAGLAGKPVSNLNVAIANAQAYAGEVVERLRNKEVLAA